MAARTKITTILHHGGPVNDILEFAVRIIITEYNPYHGPGGRFASGDSSGARVSKTHTTSKPGQAKFVAKAAGNKNAYNAALKSAIPGNAADSHTQAGYLRSAAHLAGLNGDHAEAVRLYTKADGLLSQPVVYFGKRAGAESPPPAQPTTKAPEQTNVFPGVFKQSPGMAQDHPGVKEVEKSYPPANPNASITNNRFRDSSGKLTPERQALHDGIVSAARSSA